MCATCGCSEGAKATVTNLATGEKILIADHHHLHVHGHQHHHHDHDTIMSIPSTNTASPRPSPLSKRFCKRMMRSQHETGRGLRAARSSLLIS